MPAPTQNNFAAAIEARASEDQDFVCFLSSDTGETVTYREARLRGVWLARELDAQHVARGGMIAVDMDNCPALVYAIVAAAYGGYALAFLNTRLTDAEKQERRRDLKRACNLTDLPVLDESTACALVAEADRAGAGARNQIDVWARRGVASFDELSCAVVMFTSGTSGRTKAAGLSWAQLQGAARASNSTLNTEGEGIWQLALPAYHVGGLQIVFRSVLNHNAFLLYRTFDAHKVLEDAYTYSATHISVVDKMLQDLLAVSGGPADEGTPDSEAVAPKVAALSDYECILLGGSRPNRATIARALEADAPIFVSYGLTETASQVACARITDPDVLLLDPLPGYELTVAGPGVDGFGQLGVKGPGVVEGYLNAQAAFTADGFFLTGDRGRIEGGRVEVSERSGDMFVSGGENVYPAQIRDKVLAIEGVSDAYVFGAPDDVWGRRPIAFVEAHPASSRPGFNRFFFANEMRERLSLLLSPVYTPDHFVVVDEFPRTGIGKTGTGTIERAWARRIHVKRAELWHVRLPLVAPIRTAKHKLRERDVALVRLTDAEGRTGVGECSSFATDWYLPETLPDDLAFLRTSLLPLLVGRVLLHPQDAPELFENAPGAADHPLACSALEAALWDLYGKIRKRSVRELIGARDAATEPGSLIEVPLGHVLGGAVVGIGTPAEVLDSVNAAVEAGYRRVKIKVKPGNDAKVVEAVRKAHPRLTIMLDANQSYRDEQADVLAELDAFDVACIEEPLDPTHTPAVGPTDLFDRLARLQAGLRMRVCLDESWSKAEDLYAALDAHPELRCVSVKVGKFGGPAAALAFYAWARERGIECWLGGMYDTGVSKRLHGAFGLLPGINIPGDFSDSARYFTADVCDPPFALDDGTLCVNPPDHPYGIGCDLDDDALARLQVGHWVFE